LGITKIEQEAVVEDLGWCGLALPFYSVMPEEQVVMVGEVLGKVRE
jgi:hypothetical protein